jgi:hypothetical protein
MSTQKSRFRQGAIAVAIAAGLATAFVAVAHPGFGPGPGYGPGMMGCGGPGMAMGGGPGMMGGGPGMMGGGPGMMGGGPGMMGGGPGMMMGWGHGRMFANNDVDIVKFQQEQLGQLKQQLGITAEQQPAWDAFVAQATAQAKAMQAMRSDAGTTAWPERMQQRQKAMATMSEAAAKLYEVLAPPQREVFDRGFGPMYRRG